MITGTVLKIVGEMQLRLVICEKQRSDRVLDLFRFFCILYSIQHRVCTNSRTLRNKLFKLNFLKSIQRSSYSFSFPQARLENSPVQGLEGLSYF